MRTTLAGLALSITAMTASAAFAADMPVKGQRAYSSYNNYANWTGFYVGLNAGYAFGDSRWDFGIGPAGRVGPFPVQGGMIGLTAGYNYQVSGFVVGVEGDYDWTSIRGAEACFGSNCRT